MFNLFLNVFPGGQGNEGQENGGQGQGGQGQGNVGQAGGRGQTRMNRACLHMQDIREAESLVAAAISANGTFGKLD